MKLLPLLFWAGQLKAHQEEKRQRLVEKAEISCTLCKSNSTAENANQWARLDVGLYTNIWKLLKLNRTPHQCLASEKLFVIIVITACVTTPLIRRGKFEAMQMEISDKIMTHVAVNPQTASQDGCLHRGTYIFKLFAQWMFPGSVVDGSCGHDSDIRLHSGARSSCHRAISAAHTLTALENHGDDE